MALTIGDNFSYMGAKPLDARLKYDTIAAMKAMADSTLYDGCMAYCTATGKTYQWKSTNTVDPDLGKWREFTSGGGSQVQADWSETDSSEPDFIKNKPTKVSDFTNDSGFITNTVNNLVSYYLKTETYTKTEVDALIGAITTLHFEAVNILPTTDISTTTIYLVPSAEPQTQNVKDEYINIDGTTAGWELIGSTQIDLTGYVTDAELTTALADYVTSTDFAVALAGKQDVIQVPTLPTASADNLGSIVQYIGATTASVTNGFFYKCVSDGGDPATYSWERTNAQPMTALTIKDGGTAVTERTTVNFTDFDLADDSTNEETDITPHRLTAGEMTEIMSTLPGAPTDLPVMFDETGAERQVGWYILANGKKKPVYEKTITGTMPSSADVSKYVSIGASIDYGAIKEASFEESGNIYPMPFVNGDLSRFARVSILTNSSAANKNSIELLTSHPAWVNYPFSVTVLYTKTTDTPID